MNRLLYIVATLLLLLTLAIPADAGGCGGYYLYSAQPVRGYSYYQATTSYAGGYYRYVAPVQTYSLSYDTTAEKLIELLKEEQKSNRQLVQQLLAQQQATAPHVLQQTAALDAVAILKRSCIACHAPAVADDKGESVVLFDDNGEVGTIGKALRKAAIRYVTSTDPAKRCPKKGPLPAAEVKTLVEWLKQEPAAKVQP
jgi:hypothetical protein